MLFINLIDQTHIVIGGKDWFPVCIDPCYEHESYVLFPLYISDMGLIRLIIDCLTGKSVVAASSSVDQYTYPPQCPFVQNLWMDYNCPLPSDLDLHVSSAVTY